MTAAYDSDEMVRRRRIMESGDWHQGRRRLENFGELDLAAYFVDVALDPLAAIEDDDVRDEAAERMARAFIGARRDRLRGEQMAQEIVKRAARP